MALPVYAGAGTGAATTSGSLSPALPAGTVAGDLLVMHIVSNESVSSLTPPSGWNVGYEGAGVPSNTWNAMLWKIAAGGDATNFSVVGSGDGLYARIYRYTGGSGVEGVAAGGGVVTSTIADVGVTSTAANRLAVNLVGYFESSSGGAFEFTGESGGDWQPADTVYNVTTGNDATLRHCRADLASAGTINGGTFNAGTVRNYGIIGFAVIGGAGAAFGPAVETDVALSISPVLLPAGLKDDINSAIETDTALSITPVTDSATDIDMYVAVDFGTGMEIFSPERTQSLNVRRGRANNLDRVTTGTAEGTFLNGDGYLDPSYTEGPNYGRIHPLLPIRILRRRGGVTYERFAGAIERFNPDWETFPTTQLMGIGAADPGEAWANDVLLSDYATLTTSMAGANNDLVFTAAEAGGHGDDITIEFVVAGTDTPLDAGTNDPLEGGAILHTDTRSLQRGILGALFGEKTVPPVGVDVQGSDITINVATNGSGVAISTASQIKEAMEDNPEIAALVTIALAPGNTGAGVVTALAKTNLSGGKWPEELTGTRIHRVLDLIGWPLGLRDVDAGNYIVISQGFGLRDNVSPLTHIHDVADSELGYAFITGDGTFVYHDASHRNVDARSTASQATFSNVPGSGILIDGAKVSLDKSKIVNEASVTGGHQDSIPQTVVNAHSQDGVSTPPPGAPTVPKNGYGKRAISRKTLLAYDEDCLSQAIQIVDALSYPLERFELLSTFEPSDVTEASAWVVAVLGREIGDMITAIIRPPGKTLMSTTSYQLFVEEIQDVYAPATPMKVTFVCTPTAQSVAAPPPPGIAPILNNLGNPLIIGDAVQGKIGA